MSKMWSHKQYLIIRIIVIAAVVGCAVFFGFKKHGFYIDEYYVYTFANGTQVGIAIDTGEWNDTSDYRSQLVSEGSENFNFTQTYHNVESGVHPPLYYFLIHFASSIFTGRFSKWIGLSVNILILIPLLVLVERITWKLTEGDQIVSLLTILLVGLSPVTVSMVVLTRMYLLLAVWTLLYVYIHIKALELDSLSVSRFLIPVFVSGFFGFLTQYFFVIVMFFITFVYAFYLIVICRRIKDTFIYGLTALSSLISTYFVWPISYYHIFMGHRGKGAFSQAKDISHIWERLWQEVDYLNIMVFAKMMPFFFAVLLIGMLLLIKQIIIERRKGLKWFSSFSTATKAYILVMLSAILSFLLISQVKLLEGGITCCRQLYNVYVLFLILTSVGIFKMIQYLKRELTNGLYSIIAVLIALLLLLGHVEKNVLFLFEDDIVATNYAKNHPEAKVVMFHNDDGNYDSCIQELMLYPKVYYAWIGDLSTAKDPIIASASELLVYVSTSGVPEECFESVYKQNPKITSADHLWDSESGFFSVYLLK